jgi:lysophospholipase
MDLAPAPYLDTIAEGPPGARAWWVNSADGTRLRMGLWPKGEKGTILMFPGRTEYIEKYGRLAGDFAASGYSMAAFDWRGQGLADRPQHRRDMGHVTSFDEYRQDVAAFRAALDALEVSGPFYMIAHSMGGCIGLRALHDALPVRSAAFTGPMWGIQMSLFHRSISSVVLGLAGPLGIGTNFAPTTGPWEPMVYDDNPLTTDRDQFDYIMRQTHAHPELALGGPSNLWLRAALKETRTLMQMPPPDVPSVAIAGTRERIVELPNVGERMRDWPGGRYVEIEGGEHEVLMESPARRGETLREILDWFARHP